jgi:hypothetical protein
MFDQLVFGNRFFGGIQANMMFDNRFFGGIQANMMFDNGYVVSVINGGGAYSNGDDEYELAVYGKDGYLCYDTPITDGVLGNLSADDVSELMVRVAALPSIVQGG